MNAPIWESLAEHGKATIDVPLTAAQMVPHIMEVLYDEAKREGVRLTIKEHMLRSSDQIRLYVSLRRINQDALG